MNKVIGLSILFIIFIAISVFYTNMPYYLLKDICFPHSYHVVFEGIISSIMFLIFFKAQIIYYKTQNKRMIIVATGFLAAGLLNVYHISMGQTFPYDIINVINLYNNPQLFFLLAEKSLVPISLFITPLFTDYSSDKVKNNFRKIVLISTILILLTAIILYKLIFMLIHMYNLSGILSLSQAFMPIYAMLYFITAFIYADDRLNNKKSIFSTFIIGLIIMGISQLFYINPEFLQGYEFLAHVLNIISLILILAGLKNIQELPNLVNLKQKKLAYMSIFLILVYLIFSSIISLLFNLKLSLFAF